MSENRPWATAWPRRLLSLVLFGVADGVLRAMAPTDWVRVLEPVGAAVLLALWFIVRLQRQVREQLFGEIGVLYLGLVMVYTVFPAYLFLSFDFAIPLVLEGLNVLDLSLAPAALGLHFWRHTLLVGAFAIGYLWMRRGEADPAWRSPQWAPNSTFTIIWGAVVLSCIGITTLLSAPVTNYYEHYVRFDHLSGALKRLVEVIFVVKTGAYVILLALLFGREGRWRYLAWLAVPLIVAYELWYSYGSRLQALVILLSAVGFSHHLQKPIPVRRGVAYLALLGVLFSLSEVVRSSGNDLRTAGENLARDGGGAIGEFGAVYVTGYHLYTERAQHSLPPHPKAMLVNDILAVIPGVDHIGPHPQYWYARNYFPKALVPPATIGLIAESALWGGELDLAIRGLLNGMLFAWLMRWFVARRGQWIPTVLFIAVYATCFMTLKYSLLYHLQPLSRTIVPVLLLHQLFIVGVHWLRRVGGAVPASSPLARPF